MNATLELPALREDNPRDFLAALGLLATLNRVLPDQELSLSWTEHTGVPCLHSEMALPRGWGTSLGNWLKQQFCADDLALEIKCLLKRNLDGEYAAPVFNSLRNAICLNSLVFAPTAKIDPQARRHLFELDRPDRQDSCPVRLGSALRPALMSQTHNEKPDVQRRVFGAVSSFSMANKQGQKYLLSGVQQIVTHYLVPETIESTLLGHEAAVSGAPTIRLSPEEGRDAAYFGAIPELQDFPLLNVLALCGLEFYPVVDRAKEAVTAGFLNEHFRWPTWNTPLRRDPVSVLLLHSEVFQERPRAQVLRRLGVWHLWEACRYATPQKSLFFARAVSRL